MVAKLSLLVEYPDFFSCKNIKVLGYFTAKGSLCRKRKQAMLFPWEVVTFLPVQTGSLAHS